MIKNVVVFISFLFFLTPLTASSKSLTEDIRTVLKNNPSIIIDIIKENPTLFVNALKEADKKANRIQNAKSEQKKQGRFNAALSTPLKPKITANDTIRGTKSAPIVLVQYSDFQCRNCAKANEFVQSLLQKYRGQIQFIYKHSSASLSNKAMLVAQYYEAIRMQNDTLAFKFYDKAFKNPQGLSGSEAYLIALARIVGVDIEALKKTLENKIDIINAKIQRDIDESNKFGIQTTPAFLVNGIPIKEIYTLDYFDSVIQILQKKNIINI